jgi:hypothetical protein
MDKRKQLIIKFFDSVFSGFVKSGARPVGMTIPHVLFRYMESKNPVKGKIGFTYNTELETLTFDYNTFYMAKNMFGIPIPDLFDICNEYAINKFGIPEINRAVFYTKTLM